MRPDRTTKSTIRRKRIALLLPAHNEQLIIATTIRSAIAAGMDKSDIFVVDDNSSDDTYAIAVRELSTKNVLSVPRSGKARAVQRAFAHFDMRARYCWLHVADADSIFCKDYFRIYRKCLNGKEWVAAVGFVQSLGGNWIANYRSFSYTYGQHIFRRIQSWFGMISVLPGPVTCFKTDTIKKLDFETESLTEDFDLTMQIHRKHLGRIRFIPEAVNFTQDPRTLKDFYDQTLRWQRGFFQGVRKYRIGLRPHIIDIGVGYQMAESTYYLCQLLVILPVLALLNHNWSASLGIFIADYLAICVLAIFSAVAARRPVILVTVLYFYPLRLFELTVFVQAFIEIMILRRFKTVARGWDTEGRRYEINTEDI